MRRKPTGGDDDPETEGGGAPQRQEGAVRGASEEDDLAPTCARELGVEREKRLSREGSFLVDHLRATQNGVRRRLLWAPTNKKKSELERAGGVAGLGEEPGSGSSQRSESGFTSRWDDTPSNVASVKSPV